MTHQPAGAGQPANREGTVFKKTLGQYFLYDGDRIITCSISNRLRKQLVYPTSPPESGTLRRVQKERTERRGDAQAGQEPQRQRVHEAIE